MELLLDLFVRGRGKARDRLSVEDVGDRELSVFCKEEDIFGVKNHLIL